MSRLPEIANSQSPAYQNDLGDTELKMLKPLLPKAKGFSRSSTVDFREILKAIFYSKKLKSSLIDVVDAVKSKA